MYTKNKSNRITLRLTSKQFDFVKRSSDIIGVSPSEFLRLVINQTMNTNIDMEDVCRENENALFNGII